MKKSIRLVSLLLTAVMLLGMFAITSSATGEVAGVTIKTDTDTVAAGDVITVTVNVSTNYYATSMRWPVLFTNNFFELVEGSVSTTEELANHGGSVICNENPGDAIYTTACSSDVYSGILLQWAGASASGITPYNNEEGMDCFTFQLRVKETVTMGTSGVIVVPEDSTLFYNYMLTDVEDPITPDKMVQCKDLTYNLTSKTVACPVPELLPVEGTNTVIDKENGIIRGLDLNVTENLDNYVYATAGAKVVVTSKDNRMGTGTKVELVLGEDVLETYTVIIAGDVNGDALVDITDYIWLDLAETYTVSFDTNAALAADLNGDNTVNANDKIALDSYLIFEGEINQATGVYSAA